MSEYLSREGLQVMVDKIKTLPDIPVYTKAIGRFYYQNIFYVRGLNFKLQDDGTMSVEENAGGRILFFGKVPGHYIFYIGGTSDTPLCAFGLQGSQLIAWIESGTAPEAWTIKQILPVSEISAADVEAMFA